MAVDIVEASLVSVPIESLFFGLFLLLATSSLYVITKREKEKKEHGYNASSSSFLLAFKSPIFVGGIILLIMATVHWVTSIVRVFDAFIHYPAPILFFAEVSHWTQLVKNVMLSGSTALSDAIIIYRLWVVWNRGILVAAIPAVSVVATTLCGILAAYLFRVSQVGEDIYSGAISRWVTAQIVLTLWTNIYCSVFIAGRIYYQKKQSAAYAITDNKSPLTRVLIIFIESAAFYALWIITFAITYFTKSSVAFIISDSWPCVAGMTFMSINARIYLTSTNSHSSHGNGPSSFNRPSSSGHVFQAARRGTNATSRESYGMSSMPPVEADDGGKEESRWNAV